jgi:peptide/nickel transport system ATP-binding protein
LVEPAGGTSRVRCIHYEAVQPLAISQEVNGPGHIGNSDDGRVLAVSALSANYGPSRVLEAVDLQVGREECLALVGESGSGKTTFARCVVGLHTDWSGDISFQGEHLAPSARARPRRSLQQIQFIFQNPYTSLNPRKSIEQVISQPLDNLPERLTRRERRLRVEAAIEEVSLGLDFLGQHPNQLSGGERQRVAIARALVVQPTLLVCDEVTSALDVSVQAIVVELLRRLQRERHLSLLFITHNLCLVRSVAQRIAVLENGRIVESGATADVLENPQHPYTIRLLHDVPRVETRDEARPGNSLSGGASAREIGVPDDEMS